MNNVIITENIDIHAQIPKHLLDEAQKITGLGLIETLLMGLQNIAANKHKPTPYEQLLALKGSLKDTDCFAIPIDVLRKDREF